MGTIHVGTAGWSIPRIVADRFPTEGSALQRYSVRFDVAEINSSFYRPHRISTWQRWRDSVPEAFRFSVKLPRTMTHERKLVGCEEPLDTFVREAGNLGEKFAVVLVQLPPKLEFDAAVAARFFDALAARCPAAIACEPRHPSWFTAEADAVLAARHVSRVAADPAVCEAAAVPGGWRDLSYWRLHGSPVKYRSSYADRLPDYARALQTGGAAGHEVWCIFDNTASSAAAGDALALVEAVT